MGLMTYIEVFDGFSRDHGCSHEDLFAVSWGAGCRIPSVKNSVRI